MEYVQSGNVRLRLVSVWCLQNGQSDIYGGFTDGRGPLDNISVRSNANMLKRKCQISPIRFVEFRKSFLDKPLRPFLRFLYRQTSEAGQERDDCKDGQRSRRPFR